MSFVPNSSQQISLFDSFTGLTPREKKLLEKSWAKYFAEEIFPCIDEQPFAVLYSDKDSRPSTPVNVTVGGLILKELTGQSDEEFMDSLIFDIRYQYALHTTSFVEQPISDRTFGRFRQRCARYAEETGIDLIHDAVTQLSLHMAKIMKIDGTLRRMDSAMISANIKNMSRLELLYTCVANLAKEAFERGIKLPEELLHYTEANDRNQVIYHNRSEETERKLITILRDAAVLRLLCRDDFEESSNYQLLIRVLREQTVEQEDGSLRLREKGDGGMHARMLQNPADPDATFREKAGKKYRGYVTNLEEAVGEDKNSIIVEYQVEQNTYSDAQFMEDALNRMESQDQQVIVATDAAYANEENRKKAEEKNIQLIHTNLAGTPAQDIAAEVEFNEDGTKITRCPAGHVPQSCCCSSSNGQCVASFPLEVCMNCPRRDECNPTLHKKTASKRVSLASKHRAEQQRFRKTNEFSKFARFRNGVETIPSILRRKYSLDRMPIHGLIRTRFLTGLKIGALNFKKFFRYQQRLALCAQLSTVC